METETLKKTIKITELAESLGIPLKNGKACCVWHQEKTPSLSFDDERGVFKCFGCGKAGDAIALYQEMKHVDFKTAVAELGGMEFEPPKKVEETKRVNPDVYERLVEYLYSVGRGEAVDKYLEWRGITKDTADRFMLAGISNLDETKNFLLETFGKEVLLECGLIGKTGFIFNSHPLIIPIVQDGRIVALRGRCLDAKIKMKYVQPTGIPLTLFNTDEAKLSEEIAITEGELDAIMLCQNGMTAVGVFGVDGFKDEFIDLFKGKHVVVAFDNDASGERAVKKLTEKLTPVVDALSIITPTEKDVTECYQNGVDFLAIPRKVVKEGIRIVHLSEAAKVLGPREKISTGMALLDAAMQGGLSRGNAVVIAAPSGEGKSQMMVSMAYSFMKSGHTCLWFSYEEAADEIWERFAGMGITEKDFIFTALDLSDSKIGYIEEVIKKQKQKTEFFVVFVDQLSNLFPKVTSDVNVNQVNSNYSLFLGIMSQQLKAIAMEQKIIVIYAHQIGRSGELAYSDMVRHAPDKVIHLKREAAPEGSGDEFTNVTKVMFKKNRPYGTRPVYSMTVDGGLFVPIGSSAEIENNSRLVIKDDSGETLRAFN